MAALLVDPAVGFARVLLPWRDKNSLVVCLRLPRGALLSLMISLALRAIIDLYNVAEIETVLYGWSSHYLRWFIALLSASVV
jgi:hypothetical protein